MFTVYAWWCCTLQLSCCVGGKAWKLNVVIVTGDALYICWCLLHELLLCADHVWHAKVYWQQRHCLFSICTFFTWCNLLLHAHLCNCKHRYLVVRQLELWQICHGSLYCLLCHLWCHAAICFHLFTVFWCHDQQHACTEQVACIWH